MAQKLIRNIPDEVMAIIEEKAGADGMNAEEWIRSQLVQLAAKPSVRKRYSFKAFGSNGAKATIKREHDFVQRGADGCSQEQFAAYQKAALHAERNEVGDYEEAYRLLKAQFEEVFPG